MDDRKLRRLVVAPAPEDHEELALLRTGLLLASFGLWRALDGAGDEEVADALAAFDESCERLAVGLLAQAV